MCKAVPVCPQACMLGSFRPQREIEVVGRQTILGPLFVELQYNYSTINFSWYPQNGFWWSLGFCAVLFIPVIIFSVITSTCYLRRKSEELIDSYTDYP